METYDEPHPGNTSVHAAGAERNKANAHAATWQAGAHSHILHNPLQVCELLPSALLPLRDTFKELHKHVEGAAGYIFTCFGKLGSDMCWVKALPRSRSRELQLAQVCVCQRVDLFPNATALSHPSSLPARPSCVVAPRTSHQTLVLPAHCHPREQM